MKNKKILIPLIAVLALILSFFYIKRNSLDSSIKKDQLNPILASKNAKEFSVRRPSLWEKMNKNNPEKNSLVFNDSNHGGVAAFVGPFRLEAFISNENIIGIYLDNMNNKPTYPSNTEIFISTESTTYKLKPIRNGLLLKIFVEKVAFPLNVKIHGMIRGKKFSYNETIKEIRQESIIKEIK